MDLKENVNHQWPLDAYFATGLNPELDFQKLEYITSDLTKFKDHFSKINILNTTGKDREEVISYLSNNCGLDHEVCENIYLFLTTEHFYKIYNSSCFYIRNNRFQVFLSLLSTYKVFTFLNIEATNTIFCLIQHHSNLSIWFPRLNLYVPLYSVTDSIHKEVIPEFLKVFFEAIKNIKQNKKDISLKPKLLLSYPRPYHFFTELLPSYFAIINNTNIEKNDIIFLKEKTFFVVDRDKSRIFSNESDVNEFLLKREFYLLKPVKKLINKDFNYVNYNNWVRYGSISMLEDIDNSLKKVNDESFVLWIGICSEKRAWLELNTGVKAIIEAFHKKKKSLHVVVDGLTRSELEDKDSFINTTGHKDFMLAESIIKDYPDISFTNSVGFSAKEKISLVERVNFFITSFLTDSMFVARFGRKLGVGYGANVAEFKTHRHPKTFILPNSFVNDLIEDEGQNWAKVSYSIDPEKLISFCFAVENGYEIRSPIHKMFTGKDISVVHNRADDYYEIKSLKGLVGYIGINEDLYDFSMVKDSAYNIDIGEDYFFRYEAVSEKQSKLYIIAYADGKRVFTGRIAPNSMKTIKFPEGANKFRLLIRLETEDIVKLTNVFWNTSKSANSIWLSVP